MFPFLMLINRYSNTTKETWEKTFETGIYMFLNVVNFSITLDKKEQDYIKKMRQR